MRSRDKKKKASRKKKIRPTLPLPISGLVPSGLFHFGYLINKVFVDFNIFTEINYVDQELNWMYLCD